MEFLKRSKLERCKDKLQYYKNMIYPKPRKLPIDLKYFPLEKTHVQVTNYKKIKNFISKNKNKNKLGILHFNKQKYSFTGKIISDNNDEVYFKIHFYKINSTSKKYIIEFQRRSGCALTWYKHYRYIQEIFRNNNLI